MAVIFFEIFRAIIVGFVLLLLIRQRNLSEISEIPGWFYIISGSALIFFGMVIDITDNFPALNKYVIIGDTIYQAFFEKVVGYLMGFLLFAFGVNKWLPNIVKQTRKDRENLKNAASELKLLTGLLPICGSCHKIRDDKGYWNRIESYIENHSEALFSYGLCKNCSDKLYGDESWYKDMNLEKEMKKLSGS